MRITQLCGAAAIALLSAAPALAHHSFDQLRLAFQAEYPLWIRRRRVSVRDRRLRWFLLSRGRRSEQEETSQCQPNYQRSGKGGSLASASG